MSRNGHDKGVSKVLPPILVAKTRRSPVSDEWINLGGAVPFKDGTATTYICSILFPRTGIVSLSCL